MHDDQTQQTAAAALRPMRPTEILGTAFGLYRRHWRTLLAIVAIAVPLAVSFPSTRPCPARGASTRSSSTTGWSRPAGPGRTPRSWCSPCSPGRSVFAVVAGAVTRAAVAAVAGEDLGVGGATGSRSAGCGRCSW